MLTVNEVYILYETNNKMKQTNKQTKKKKKSDVSH